MNKKLIPTDELSGLDDLLNDPRIKTRINIDNLLPIKYQPKTKRHFIVSVDGVDSFLVSNVNEMPEFKKDWFSKTTLRCVGDLKITFYSPAAPSTIQQLAELFLNKKFDIVLKQLDPTGTVVAQQTFKKCKLDGFRISNHSYDSNDLEKVLATFKCKSVSVDF